MWERACAFPLIIGNVEGRYILVFAEGSRRPFSP